MSKPINPVKGKKMGGTFDVTPDLRQARRLSLLNTLTMDHEGRSLPQGKHGWIIRNIMLHNPIESKHNP